MQDPHVPNLEAIDAVEDLGVRLYAMIGATMTFASTLELSIFRLYREASCQSTEDAAALFYRIVKFAHKRDLTDRAVTRALAGHRFLDLWPDILRQIQQVCGDDAARNLVGHNPIEDELRLIPNPDTGDADLYVRYFVRQNPLQVQIGNRREQQANYDTLRDYAVKLYACQWTVKDFIPRIQTALGRYQPADDLGPEPTHLHSQPKSPETP